VLASTTMLAPRSHEQRPNTRTGVLAAWRSATRSTAHSSSTACSEEHEAASLCPDLQTGRKFRDTRKNVWSASDAANLELSEA
jgi:hypothetical protein